jgi:hypothetical protein
MLTTRWAFEIKFGGVQAVGCRPTFEHHCTSALKSSRPTSRTGRFRGWNIGNSWVNQEGETMGTQGGRDDEELRREHREHEEDHPDYARGQEREEIHPGHPDYARGQEREEIHTGHPDFARGQRQDETHPHEGDVAPGQEDPESDLETHDGGDFARGQRRGDPDRG